MEYSTITTLISTLGFPIVCCVALGWFIYKSYNAISEREKEREDKLYEIIVEAQSTNERLTATNQEFMAVLETYKNDINDIKGDINDIKNSIIKTV